MSKNMSKTQAVLFDLDGTLIDTAADFIRIIKLMCAKYNHPCPTDEAIRGQVSAGAKAMIRLMFGSELANMEDTDPKLLAYRQEFLDLYEADICVDSRLFDGLDELLSTLESRSIAWGIVTNKPRYLAEQLLTKLNLQTRCSVLVCPEDVQNAKPDPESLLLASKTLKIASENCLYIGDHSRDILAGKLANMPTVAVRFGYIVPNENIEDWGADYIIDTPKQLSDFILTQVL